MPNVISADKSWDDLWSWSQADPKGLVDYTFALQSELRALKDSAAQNSSNSSRPPSTDREKPAPKSLREKSGRKPGGQPGHPGTTLAFSDRPDEIQIHPLLECSQCGEDLSQQPAEDYEARQVYDLPERKLRCTENRAEIKDCPCCHCRSTASFPDEAKAPVQYGTDFLSSYLGFENCLHTFCKSHLMREWVFLFEQHHQTWAKDLHDLFREMLQGVKQRKARDAPLNKAEYKRWHQRYGQILGAGRQANPLTPDQQAKKRRKQSKEQNLLDRLEGYDDAILAFLWQWELPFTNNDAERAFRMVKVRVKISGCFRTLEGARQHLRIRSYISTLRKHGLPVLEYLRRALDGDPFLPHGSKST